MSRNMTQQTRSWHLQEPESIAGGAKGGILSELTEVGNSSHQILGGRAMASHLVKGALVHVSGPQEEA